LKGAGQKNRQSCQRQSSGAGKGTSSLKRVKKVGGGKETTIVRRSGRVDRGSRWAAWDGRETGKPKARGAHAENRSVRGESTGGLDHSRGKGRRLRGRRPPMT